MPRTLYLCLMTCALALCFVKAAASPVAGLWEGAQNGRKAVTLDVRETDGILGGAVVFYILRDNGSGEHDGDATPALPLVGTTWDGRTLRFSVEVEGGGHPTFEMTLTAAGDAEFKRLGGDLPVIRMRRRTAR